jgi:SAM-dependent methyltransferase
MTSRLPTHDSDGLHILDPKDSLGRKSDYITLLHERALRRHIPKGTSAIAVDLGCGFGRLTPLLVTQGWRAIGIDPSKELLQYAREHHPGPEYVVGGLPDLPVAEGSVELLLIQNVFRALKMIRRLDVVSGFGRFLAPSARVLVVENIRSGHPEYLPESAIIEMMQSEGLHLIKRIPLRAARWWGIYLIRYGIIPTRFLSRFAEWELDRMARRTRLPKWQYWNVLYVFSKSPQ